MKSFAAGSFDVVKQKITHNTNVFMYCLLRQNHQYEAQRDTDYATFFLFLCN